jgi:putative PIN family toxin of toxin-antitoxin system
VLRVVVDTNLFVSALLSPRGAPAQILQAWKERHFVLLCSAGILTEIEATLTGFVGREPYQVTNRDVDELLELLRTEALMTPGNADVSDATISDADDLIFLACALEGQADAVASGDSDLTALHSYHDIPILNARQLIDRLADETD